MCLYRKISFPWTHSIAQLLTILENNGEEIPQEVRDAEVLTVYATDTRYPGDWEPIEEKEYLETLGHAKTVFDWVNEMLENIIK